MNVRPVAPEHRLVVAPRVVSRGCRLRRGSFREGGEGSCDRVEHRLAVNVAHDRQRHQRWHVEAIVEIEQVARRDAVETPERVVVA